MRWASQFDPETIITSLTTTVLSFFHSFILSFLQTRAFGSTFIASIGLLHRIDLIPFNLLTRWLAPRQGLSIGRRSVAPSRCEERQISARLYLLALEALMLQAAERQTSSNVDVNSRTTAGDFERANGPLGTVPSLRLS